MSRNMIAQNIKVFDLLQKRVISNSDTSSRLIISGRRHIQTKEVEKDWLKNLILISHQSIFSNFQAAICCYQNETYFIYVGEEVDIAIEGFEPIELNAGIFTALIGELNIQVIGDPISIFNTVFYQDFEDDKKMESLDRWSYKFEQLSEFFMPFCIYKVAPDSPFQNSDAKAISISRLIAFFLIKTKKHMTLKFLIETLNDYEKIILETSQESTWVPYDNLLSSLIAYKWKYSFLEVYRCLEQLFSVVNLMDVHQKIKTSIDLMDLANYLEKGLGWHPQEDQAINEMIKESSTGIKEILEKAKVGTDYNDENIEKFFYKIRNDIVHFRARQKEPDFDNTQWNLLVQASLRLITLWYKKYEKYQSDLAKVTP
jgi:hypothetical protein